MGLDAAGYIKGQAAARQSLKAMSAEERAAAKDAEEFSKLRSEGYRKLAGTIIGLYAVFTGGRSIAQFTRDITNSDAATGRLAHNVGLSTQELTAWEGAAERAGGSSTGVAGSIRGLTQEMQQFALTGQSSVVPYFRYLGIQISDANGKIRPMSALLLDLASKFQGMDPARAQALGGSLGLDEGTINLLEQGPAAVQALIDKQKQLGLVSAEDADRAIKLKNAVLDLEQRFTSFGRTLLNHVTPIVVGFLDRLGTWMDRVLPGFAEKIGSGFESLVKWVEAIDWEAAWKRAEEFGARVMAVLHAIEVWRPPAWLRIALGLPSDIDVGGNAAPDAPSADPTAKPNDAVRNDHPTALGRWLYDHFDRLRGPDNRLHAPADQLPPGTAPPIVDPNTGMPTPDLPSAFETHSPTDPRGVRNNNPGNLQYAGQEGATKEAGVGGRFAVFGTMLDGLRALAHQLKLYESRGIDTVRGIISKYAPSFENDTSGYIGSVVKSLGLDPDQKLNLSDNPTLKRLMQAITTVEVGRGHISGDQIDQAINLQIHAAAAQTMHQTNTQQNNARTSSVETNINGPINIHTAATDAKGIARGLGDAVRKHSFVPQADFGLA